MEEITEQLFSYPDLVLHGYCSDLLIFLREILPITPEESFAKTMLSLHPGCPCSAMRVTDVALSAERGGKRAKLASSSINPCSPSLLWSRLPHSDQWTGNETNVLRGSSLSQAYPDAEHHPGMYPRAVHASWVLNSKLSWIWSSECNNRTSETYDATHLVTLYRIKQSGLVE